MATIGTLIVKIGADIGDLRKGLQEGQEEVRKTSNKLAGVSNLMKGAVVAGAVAASAAVVGLGSAAVGVGAAAVDMASQMRQSQNDIQAQLGVTADVAQGLGDVAVNVFKNNFGDSVDAATQAVIIARQQLGNLTDNELQDATENAFRLADAYGVNVGESLSAVRTLTEEFGMSQQEAFDFLASGFQKGLNASDDFLDTIGEYSNLFAQSGADAGQFFSLMETGLAGGVLGTDRAADAFKEFQVRFLEGSDEVLDAIATLSDDGWKQFYDEIQSGHTTVAEMAEKTIKWLGEIEDPIERNRLGVAMFGTQFEDLGADAVLGIDMATTSLEELSGSTDKLDAQYDNLGAVFEGFKRRALVAIAPVGDKLLELANRVMPHVEMAFGWLEEKLPMLIDYAVEVIGRLAGFVEARVLPILMEWGGWFFNEGLPAIVNFATPIIQQLIPGLVQLATWAGDIAGVVLPLLGQAIQFVVDHFNIIGPVLGVVAGLILALSSPITLVIGALMLLATAWANNWGGIQEKTQAVIDFVSNLIQGALALINGWWSGHGGAVAGTVSALWNTVKTIFGTALNLIKLSIQGWVTLIQNFWQQWGDTITGIAQLAWDTIKTIIKTALDVIGFAIDAAAALMRGDWSALGDALQGIWRAAWDGIQTALSNAKEGLILAIGQLKDDIMAIWSGIKDLFEEVGSNIVAGIKKGIKDAWDDFVDWFEDQIDDLIDSIFDLLGIGSPSRVFMDIGREIQAGLALGLMGNAHMPERALNQTVTHISNQFSQTINTSYAGNAGGEFVQMRARLGT